MKTNVTGLHKDAGSQMGFSIVELMTVIAILGILAAAAVPGFTTFVNNNRLAAVSNDLTATLQSARLEATRRGVQVHLCPSNDGATCVDSATWRGWVAFADTNGNNSVDSGEMLRSMVLRAPIELLAGPELAASGRIVFRHDGFAYDESESNLIAASMRACIATTSPAQNARDLSIRTGGRVSVARTNGGGRCRAPSDP